MTKAEALAFLELPEDASDSEIRQTMEGLLEHFLELSEKAPSDFLRKLNAQKVSKIRAIGQDFSEWSREPSPSKSVVLTQHDPGEEDDLPESAPIIISHGSRSSLKNTSVTEPAGWLVRHTENQSPKTYSLWKGNNYIGRKLHETLKPFLVIEEDLFISRVHALISVEGADNRFSFYIEDSADSNRGAESKNGTYLNGNEKRITFRTKLNENDTIQIGVTKLILRYNLHPIKKIVKEVEKSKFMHTVALEL
jgi:hypothetical protein